MKLEFSRYNFEKNSDIKLIKILSVGAELFHTVERTDMTKLIVTFRNFANAPRNAESKLRCKPFVK